MERCCEEYMLDLIEKLKDKEKQVEFQADRFKIAEEIIALRKAFNIIKKYQ